MHRSHVEMSGRDLKEFIEANAGVDFSFSQNANSWRSRCPLEMESANDSFFVFNSPRGEFYCTECKQSGGYQEFLQAWKIVSPSGGLRDAKLAILDELVATGSDKSITPEQLEQENLNLSEALAKAQSQIEDLTRILSKSTSKKSKEAVADQAARLEEMMKEYQLLRLQLTMLVADFERCFANLKNFLG